MTTATQTLDDLIREYTAISEDVTRLTERLNDIKAQIRTTHEPGSYSAAGLKVTVSEPARRFNLEKAVQLLPDEARPLCKLEGYDAKKVKSYLPPVLLDAVMEPGTGERVVRIS